MATIDPQAAVSDGSNPLGALYASRRSTRAVIETNNETIADIIGTSSQRQMTPATQLSWSDLTAQTPNSQRVRRAYTASQTKRYIIDEARLPSAVRARLPPAKRGRPSHDWIRAYNKVVDDYKAGEGRDVDLTLAKDH
jgi:hypothetical protein